MRVIGDGGEQLGILPLFQALQIARERNLDLVEVAPTSVPPVCRLLDYARWKYEQAKKEREARKNQKSVMIKEVRFRPKIDEHDIDFKTKQIQKFLGDGDKVKVTVQFRGREMAHPQLAKTLLDNVASKIRSVGSVERPALLEGRSMYMILTPTASAVQQASRPPAGRPAEGTRQERPAEAPRSASGRPTEPPAR